MASSGMIMWRRLRHALPHIPLAAANNFQIWQTSHHPRFYTVSRRSGTLDPKFTAQLHSPVYFSSPIVPRLPANSIVFRPTFCPAPRRHIAALALRGGASVVGGLMAFVLFQALQRLDWNQKRRMRQIFRSYPQSLQNFKPGPLFLPRTGKLTFTRDVTDADPSGPIVVTGPVGSGKTMILKRTLASRPHSVYFSLRATPVTSGDSLALALVTQLGYLMPPTELLSRAIFNRDMSSQQNILAEIDRALRLVNEVLEEEKARGWLVKDAKIMNSEFPLPVAAPPLICIDELNLNEVGSGLLDDANFWKLIDWAMHISDNRLGHVIFGCGLEVAEMLDAHPGFRMRRTKIHYDFPRPDTVRDYFIHTVNPFLKDTLNATSRSASLMNAKSLPAKEAASVDATTAPNSAAAVAASTSAAPPPTQPMKVDDSVRPDETTTLTVAAENNPDATKIVAATTRQSQSSEVSTQRMMPWEFDARIESTDPDREYRTSSSTLFTLEPWEIDRLVDVIGGQLKDIDTVVSAVLRGKHWSMPLERLIADSCDLVERTFDELLAGAAGAGSGTANNNQKRVLPRARAGSRLGMSGYASPSIPSVDFAVNPTPERLAAYARYLRGWALLSALSQRKYIAKRDLVARFFSEVPHELDFFMDAGLIMSINVKTSAKMHVGVANASSGVGSPTPVFGQAGATSLTLPGTYVSASSPRMRVAFRVLTADPKLRAQMQRIAATVSLARLRADEEKLLKRLQEVATERTFAAQQLSLLMARDTALRGSVVKEMLGAGASMQTKSDESKHEDEEEPLDAHKAAVWSMHLPLSEELPPLGMSTLQQALKRAEKVVKVHDEEIQKVRDRLAEVRSGIIAAQRKADVPLPGTETLAHEYGVLSDKTAAAMGAVLDRQLLIDNSDSDLSDDDDATWTVPSPFRRRPSGVKSVPVKQVEGETSADTKVDSPPAKPPAWNSLEVYRGNAARSIQMYTNSGGYVYKNGRWEYVSGSASPAEKTSPSEPQRQAQTPDMEPGYSPNTGYRWWL